MARGKKQDLSLLEMALVGYEAAKKNIEEKIREIRAQLGGKKVSARSAVAAVGDEGPKGRRLSAAARKRIAVAQRKRWREHRKAAAAAKSPS